jgi:hypothetical protein
MKRSDLLPVVLLIPVLGFVAVQAVQAPSITATAQAASLAPALRTGAHAVAQPAGEAAPVPVSDDDAAGDAKLAADARDLTDVRRRIAMGQNGTYITEILLERDSALARWPERVSRPIRVWVGTGTGLVGWDDSFQQRVRDAFDDWSLLGIPVKFTYVPDSVDADVHVSWIDHFDTPISGKTLWARDRSWWIVNGNITLALHHNGGESLDSKAIHAIALHEVGHLLGLDHTADTTNIMTARVRVRDLSDADRATMKLLYSLPPGSVK